MPEIKFNKYILRDINLNDDISMYSILSDLDVSKYLYNDRIYSVRDARELIEEEYLNRLNLNIPVGYAICELKSNIMIGLIAYHSYNKLNNSCELEFFLAKEYWSKGIMHKALKKVISLGFNHLELSKIYLNHVSENLRCKKLCDDFNFKYEKKSYNAFNLDGKKIDILNYSLDKIDWKGDII
jgi:RimJ/RimL family protein N-acetyltransferase